MVDQSIFYRGKLQAIEVPIIDSDKKTAAQYEAELRNLIAHGITAPLVYQSPGDMGLLKRALEIRDKVGVSTDRFFFCAWGVGPEDDAKETRRVLGAVMALARSFGYRELYNFGPDEPSLQEARDQAVVWRSLQKLGWRTYTAINALTDSTGRIRPDLWKQVKGALDLSIVGGRPNNNVR